MAFEPEISAVTLAGSLLSFVATTAVLASFAAYPKEQRTFRHALILNLTFAEFMNSLNNSISGIIYLRDTELVAGPACTANGFIGQLSVQAADFSILAIALVTVLTVTRRIYLPTASTSKKALFVVSVWAIPLFTSSIATGLGGMAPVAGNWCWISAARPDLRYALTHAWRFGVIFATVVIYGYTWWYMSRHFRTTVATEPTGWSAANEKPPMTTASDRSSIDEDETPPVSRATSLRRSLSLVVDSISGKKAREERARLAMRDVAEAKEALDREVLDRELEVFGRPVHAPVKLLPPPPARSAMRKSSAGFGLSYLQADGTTTPDPSALEAGTRTRMLEVGDTRKSVAWRLPSMPATPTTPWGSSFKQFEAGLESPDSPATPPPAPRTPALSIWPQPYRQSTERMLTPHRQSPGRVVSRSPSPPPPPARRTNKQATLMTNASEFPMRRETRQVEREIKRMMLLNAYPIFYILLSVPGLANRLREALTGERTPGATAQALAVSTQFIGVANALTYGFNRHVRHRIKGDLFGWMRGR